MLQHGENSRESLQSATNAIFIHLAQIYILTEHYHGRFGKALDEDEKLSPQQSHAEIEELTDDQKLLREKWFDDEADSHYESIGSLWHPGGTDTPSSDTVHSAIEEYRKYFFRLVRLDEKQNPFSVQQEMSRTAETVLHHDPEDYWYRLMHINPLVGTMAGHLYSEAEADPSRHSRKISEWFLDGIQHAEKAHKNVDIFFGSALQRLEKRRDANEKQLLGAFLHDCQNDMKDVIAAAVHTLNNFACHAQEENCAVFMPRTSYPLKESERNKWENRMKTLLAFPVYQQYPKTVEGAGVKNVGRKKWEVSIPTFVSVADVCDFLALLADFWEGAASGRMEFDFNHAQNGERQHRIRMKQKKFDDFNLRIDMNQYGKIGLDIGGIRKDAAYRYAAELGEKSNMSEIVMAYSDIVDKNGRLSRVEDPSEPFPRGARKQPYVSVMKSQALSMEEKAALVSAAVMNAGQAVILHHGRHFTYHLFGRLNAPQYRENFPFIVQSLKKLLQ